jgi:ferritin-like metal-binding protein YciE
MRLETVRDLLLDLFGSENQVARALPRMAAGSSAESNGALQTHFAETQDQV